MHPPSVLAPSPGSPYPAAIGSSRGSWEGPHFPDLRCTTKAMPGLLGVGCACWPQARQGTGADGGTRALSMAEAVAWGSAWSLSALVALLWAGPTAPPGQLQGSPVPPAEDLCIGSLPALAGPSARCPVRATSLPRAPAHPRPRKAQLRQRCAGRLAPRPCTRRAAGMAAS